MNYLELFSTSWRNLWRSWSLWLFAIIILLASIFAFLRPATDWYVVALLVQCLCILVGITGGIRVVFEIQRAGDTSFHSVFAFTKPFWGRVFLVELIAFSSSLILVAPLSYFVFRMLVVTPSSLLIGMWVTGSTFVLVFVMGVLSFFPLPEVIIREKKVGDAIGNGLKTLTANPWPATFISALLVSVSILQMILVALMDFYVIGDSADRLDIFALYLSYLHFAGIGFGQAILLFFTWLMTPFFWSVSTMAYLKITER